MILFGLLSYFLPIANARQNSSEPNRDAESAEAPHVEWEGSVSLPGGMKLEILVKFTESAEVGKWSATIDIPIQGAFDLPLKEVVVSDTELAFTIAPPANAIFHANIDPDNPTSAEGELNQNGMTFPLVLSKVAEGEKPTVGRVEHPQTPKPPFPYQTREVAYENKDAGIKLAGTLTIPEGDGPFPAVVMITGSGAQDRDESLLGHKPFAVIADNFTRHGIAVLRADDRGVGGSTGDVGLSTSTDFADDALAGVEFLKLQKEVDPSHIGLIGHSKGGLVAPIAAAKSDDVDFIILLAGTGVDGREILIRQLADIARSSGAEEAFIKRQTAAQTRFLDLLVADNPDQDQITEALRYLSYLQTDPENADHPDQISPEIKNQIDAMAPAGLVQYQSPWFKAFLKFDPRTVLVNVHCPVLALNGSLDTQVAADLNIPEITKALEKAGNKNATTRIFPGLNHLFQHCETGSPGEYASIAETISPEVLEYMTNWLRRTVGLE